MTSDFVSNVIAGELSFTFPLVEFIRDDKGPINGYPDEPVLSLKERFKLIEFP
jgi:hypothetical protein